MTNDQSEKGKKKGRAWMRESLVQLCRWLWFGKGERTERGGDKTIVYRLLFSTSGVGMVVRWLSWDGPLVMATTALGG